jgi:hypothetical protein
MSVLVYTESENGAKDGFGEVASYAKGIADMMELTLPRFISRSRCW